MYENEQNARIYMIPARKLSKYLNYFLLFARKINKIPRILYNNCPKNIFFRIFQGGACPLPPSPTPMVTDFPVRTGRQTY